MSQHPPSARYSQILKQERQRRGLSQKELAEQVDATLVTISNWERGKTLPDPYHRRQLSTLFGKSLAELGLAEEQSEDSNREQPPASALPNAAELASKDLPVPSVERPASALPDTAELASKDLPVPSVETPESELASKEPPVPSVETPESDRSSHRGISRRTVLVRLGGVALVGAVGAGMAWLSRVQGSHGFAVFPAPAVTVRTTLYTYHGHTDWVWSVAWSPDGKRLASAGDDQTVRVWDAANGHLFSTYTGHSHSVRAVAWSPDGKQIASGSWDKTVQVWQAG